LTDDFKKSEDYYAEWDEWETINAVKNSLEKFHEVILIEADINAYKKFIDEKPDIVFNIAEGGLGFSREAQIPAILDFLNIPYTASDPLTLSICLNKARTKEILSYYKIPTARFSLINSSNELLNSKLNFPIIIKPVAEGSSKGVFNSSLIYSFEQVNGFIDKYVEQYQQPLIAEEFLEGREFTVALMGNGNELEVLPIVEINFAALPKELNPIYSYEAKWIFDSPQHQLDMYLCPADIDKDLENKIKQTCIDTFNALNCKDWSRIDIRLDKNNIPHVIEVNPLPGILPDPKNNSCYPKSARTAGLDYDEMINNVLYFALKRYGMA
jgi:D-alanine-D-alanine ligase